MKLYQALYLASFAAFIALDGCKGEDHCVMYSSCGVDADTGLNVNCPTNNTAQPLNDAASAAWLRSVCISLPLDEETRTCCDGTQVLALKTNFEILAPMFQRCPSCYMDLTNVFCHLTCSPKQSSFMEVTKITNIAGKDCVTELSYYITEFYAVGLFDACKNVKMSNSPDPAMSAACGGSNPCSPHKWLKYMGGHDPSPFQINFQFINETSNETLTDEASDFTPMNSTLYTCNEAPHGSTSCSCVDCPCTPALPPPVDCPFMLFGWPGMYSIMLAVFVLLYITIVAGFTYKFCRRQQIDDDDECLLTMHDEKSGDQVPPSCWENLGERLELCLQEYFVAWGKTCALYPLTVLFFGLIFILVSSCGLLFFTLTTDPVELWSSPTSEVREEKDYFDQHFMPFYRTEQIIITRNNDTMLHDKNVTYSNLFDRDFLHKILAMQSEIEDLPAFNNDKTIRLQDICFSPLSNGKCMIQSVVNWFQNNASHLDYYDTDEYLTFLKNCTSNSLFIQKKGLSCLGDYGGPVFPYVALGGVGNGNYLNASALIITFMVNNHVDKDNNSDAMAWEKRFLEYVQNFSDPDMTLSYSSERSIQDELNRESRSDVKTIVISYLVMFVYVSIALGQYHSPKLLLVKSKILLGLGGVLIVLASVASSVGIFSYFGVPSTLIIIEVIPFLVLAVGVDNIFILVQAFSRYHKHDLETREEYIGRVFGQVAPSLLLASLSESTCFFLGALSNMPAVHIFALYSGLALLIDFFLQITCFLALFCLDARREESGRYDILCCVKSPNVVEHKKKQHGCLYNAFEKFYAPFLMKRPVRASVLILFLGWLCSSIAVVSQIEVGLDQKLSMPEDSYVLRYFNSLEKYLSVGPPVYFVVKSGFNYSNDHDQNMLCSVAYCYRESLPKQLLDATVFKNRTYIAHPPMNWLDSYFGWISSPSCCQMYKNDSSKFCQPTDKSNLCKPCKDEDDPNRRPDPGKFYTFFDNFLDMNPTPDCADGGHAAFADAVELRNKTNDELGATYFMTYHTILKTSEDYTGALKSAREISKNITETFKLYNIFDVEVFPYSIFYVFYEQYLTVLHDTIVNITISLVDIFIVTLLLMALDFHSSLILVLTILSITLNLMGLMYWWNISLNAVSLVNLVMSVGISVEFCSHITRAFAIRSHGNRVQRAQYALAHMGSSVLSGITLTKFGGIMVLAFSKSMIFRVFYFRMYLGIVLIGASHGLIFLPVLLSVIGPPIRKVQPSAPLTNGSSTTNEFFSENSTNFSASHS